MPDKLSIEHIRRKAFQLALFDLDGTLIDSAPDLAAAVDHCLHTMGLPVAGETKVRSWVGNGAPVLIKRALTYGVDCWDKHNRHPSGKPELTDEFVAKAYRHFLDFYQQNNVANTRLYPGAVELLEHWAKQPGIQMGLVTNKPEQFTLPICQQLSIAQYFKVIYSGDTFAARKPDPLPLLKACETLRVAVAETIMVGDSRNDLLAAKNADITGVCVSYGYNHGGPIAAEKPDVLVDSLTELM